MATCRIIGSSVESSGFKKAFFHFQVFFSPDTDSILWAGHTCWVSKLASASFFSVSFLDDSKSFSRAWSFYRNNKNIKELRKIKVSKLWSVEEQREEIRDGMKFLCGSSSPASSVTFKPFKRRLVRNRFFLILSLFWCLFFPVFNEQKHVCYKGWHSNILTSQSLAWCHTMTKSERLHETSVLTKHVSLEKCNCAS